MDANQLRQDWDVVTVRKKAPSRTAPASATITQARQSGVAVETMKKYDAGRNRAVKPHPTVSARRLENDDDDDAPARPREVDRSIQLTIQQARVAKQWTQAQLAQRISERASVINELESGRGERNPQVLQKLERVLGVKLLGHR
eukprot:GAFH01006035.1.p2 GENE.GAFH01006035.1~~GAFH01006035.1.p2  ORF type:complete len:153 (-),score=17.90 GAFH01006035.1:90-521(-)